MKEPRYREIRQKQLNFDGELFDRIKAQSVQHTGGNFTAMTNEICFRAMEMMDIPKDIREAMYLAAKESDAYKLTDPKTDRRILDALHL